MAIYYSNNPELEQYRQQLISSLRETIQSMLNKYSIISISPRDLELDLLKNGTKIGTCWVVSLKAPGKNPFYLIPSEHLSNDEHQVAITIQFCEVVDGHEDRLYRWVLTENITLPMGLRYNVQDDVVSVDICYSMTQFFSTQMISTMLLAAIKVSEDTFSKLSEQGILFKPLSDHTYQVILPEVGIIPEGIKKYVRRLN